MSLNEAVGLKDTPGETTDEAGGEPAPKWEAKEIKPRVQDVAHNLTVLKHADGQFGEEVNAHTGDFAYYFNQYGLAPNVLWMSCLLWRFEDNGTRAPNFESGVDDAGVSIISEKGWVLGSP